MHDYLFEEGRRYIVYTDTDFLPRAMTFSCGCSTNKLTMLVPHKVAHTSMWSLVAQSCFVYRQK